MIVDWQSNLSWFKMFSQLQLSSMPPWQGHLSVASCCRKIIMPEITRHVKQIAYMHDSIVDAALAVVCRFFHEF